MTAALELNLDIASKVYFDDPDSGVSSGHYMIMEIVSDSGRIESNDTVLVLDDKHGGVIEAFAKEVR